MINVSPKQIKKHIGFKKNNVKKTTGLYDRWIIELEEITRKIEELTGTPNILTSNKIWEVLIAAELGHSVNPEQGGRAGAHDAFDDQGKTYEYKISKNPSWNFQDISDNVLRKYLSNESIILALVDKGQIRVENIYSALPKKVVSRLEVKLQEKAARFKERGKILRRLQVSLSSGDLEKINAVKIV